MIGNAVKYPNIDPTPMKSIWVIHVVRYAS